MATRIVNYLKHPCDFKLTKTSGWGNPYKIGPDGDGDEVVEKYREWFKNQPKLIETARREFKNTVLGCTCKPAACHGDVIAEFCNLPEHDFVEEECLVGHFDRDWNIMPACKRCSRCGFVRFDRQGLPCQPGEGR